mmetsp:Transcript_11560/g.24337  ORF Transcript_11560/g.24337 Transcript_11560/m.24337 type:complete len:211 (+) Transcript_11560:93-725(+)
MSRTFATIASLAALFAFPLAAEASESKGLIASACEVLPVPGFCPNDKTGPATPACEGPACCTGSSCYPGGDYVSFVGCDSSRGDTTCEGDSFPVTKGMCKCKTGTCGANGVCTMASSAPTATATAGTPAPFGTLYEKEDFVVPPEDFTMVFALIGVAGAGLLTMSTMLACRVRRSWRQAAPAAQLQPDGHEALYEQSEHLVDHNGQACLE